MKTKLSYDELKMKMQYYCSYQERCHSEVLRKIKTYSANYEECNSIISDLIKDDYLNETRFTKTFSRGKFNFKNWGKNRIKLELKKRNISEKNIELGLKEIDDKDYEKKFEDLFEFISSKHKNLGKLNRKKKVFDYLQYRGWENDKIFKKINEL